MKHLKKYETYINESVDYQLLLEDKKFNFYRSVQDKTMKKLSLNLYFVGTFQMGVTVLYPVVEALVKNSNVPNIKPEQIVLMTIFSITQILNIFNEDVKKIKAELEKDDLLEITKKVKESLDSVYKIFGFVSRSFGKVVDVFTDMLAYVSLGVPTYMALIEIISREGLNLDTLPQKVLVFGGGIAAFTFKAIIDNVIALVKNKITTKNFESFASDYGHDYDHEDIVVAKNTYDGLLKGHKYILDEIVGNRYIVRDIYNNTSYFRHKDNFISELEYELGGDIIKYNL